MEQKVVNIEGLLNYPVAIKDLPFCDWRLKRGMTISQKSPMTP